MIRLDAVRIGSYVHVRVYSHNTLGETSNDVLGKPKGMLTLRGKLTLPAQDWEVMRGCYEPPHISGIVVNETP
jgi:hypothetical protein